MSFKTGYRPTAVLLRLRVRCQRDSETNMGLEAAGFVFGDVTAGRGLVSFTESIF